MQNRRSALVNSHPYIPASASAGFESAVDFFTLLSFALIVASVVYGTQRFASVSESMSVALHEIGTGVGGTPTELPKETSVFILTKETGMDLVHLNHGDGVSLKLGFDPELIPEFENALENELDKLRLAKDIFVVLSYDDPKDQVSTPLATILGWLQKQGFTNFHAFFKH